ncbi:hypothetical protein E0Z10_g1281 [Xylaria hypoxylon]|uniref:Uncharacterized protein n=1 Tax=Xylaria hypoxylon TaxID=37992 RepID=A0A4Z0ZCX3_9PEZI|nr:hypothetical protein E0Z10_g1281 [Xylaria hypoxylon]
MFTPDPSDVEDYRVAQAEGRLFWLGPLPAGESQEAVEEAIRRTPGCAGNVTVYWSSSGPKAPNRKHRGWCHILTQTWVAAMVVRDHLNNMRVTDRSATATTRKPQRPIAAFGRITRVGEVSANIQAEVQTLDQEHAAFIEEASLIAEDADALSEENLALVARATSFAKAASALSRRNADFAKRAAAFAEEAAAREGIDI